MLFTFKVTGVWKVLSQVHQVSVSINSINMTITMQGLTVTATTDAEKCCLPFKVTGVWKVLSQVHQVSVSINGINMTITMQGLTVILCTAILVHKGL